MKNKKVFIIISAIVILGLLTLVLFSTVFRGKGQESVSYERLSLTSPQSDKSKVEDVFSDDALTQENFALLDDTICFIDAEGYASIHLLSKDETKRLSSKSIGGESTKVVSTGSSCLFQVFNRTENNLYSYLDGKFASLDYAAPYPIYSNGPFYIITDDNKIIVLSDKLEKISEIQNETQDVYLIAPLQSGNVFEITGYDQEAATGNISLEEGGQLKSLQPVQNVLGLKANQNYAFLTYQLDNMTSSKIIDRNGKTVATLEGVDPESVAVADDGFYFATKPGGPEELDNLSNILGFISNSGKVTTYLSSVDESENQISANNISLVSGYLYFLEGTSVKKIKI